MSVENIAIRGHFGLEHWAPDDGDRTAVLEFQRLMEAADRLGQRDLAYGYQIEIDRLSRLRWTLDQHNLIVTTGKNEILDKAFNASAFSAAYYMGLKSAGTVAVGDTSAAHAAWTEPSIYSQSTRPQVLFATPSGGVITNTNSKAVFTITASYAVPGLAVWTVNNKGGATGILVNAVDFAVPRGVVTGDTLRGRITYSIG